MAPPYQPQKLLDLHELRPNIYRRSEFYKSWWRTFLTPAVERQISEASMVCIMRSLSEKNTFLACLKLPSSAAQGGVGFHCSCPTDHPSLAKHSPLRPLLISLVTMGLLGRCTLPQLSPETIHMGDQTRKRSKFKLGLLCVTIIHSKANQMILSLGLLQIICIEILVKTY